MPAKTLGAAIASAGKTVNSKVAGRLGRINDVHKAAVEGHYKAEAQQRAHEHTHSMLDKAHKYSGGGRVNLSVGADGSHSVSYKKGKSGGGKSGGSETPSTPAPEAPKPAEKKPATPRKPREPKIVQTRDHDGNITGSHEPKTRAQHAKELAEQKAAASPKSSTGTPAAKPGAKATPAAKPGAKATPATKPAAKAAPAAKPAPKTTDKGTK
jgi:hypothetical protein